MARPTGSEESSQVPDAAGPGQVPPPLAPVHPVVQEIHGVRRVDEYAWLRDPGTADTTAYLQAERDYYDARTAHTQPLQTAIYDEMCRRTVPADRSVSWTRGGLVYYTQTLPGKEYEQFLRDSAQDSPAEVLLDENALAAGSSFLALGLREASPDGQILAYSMDLAGDEVYELRFRDLRTGQDLPDRVPRSYYGSAWSADSTTFFYVVHDEAYRPYQVRRHRLGTDPAGDAIVYTEEDERFEVVVQASRSGGLVVIHSEAKDTSEVWLVPADRPEEPARLVEARQPGRIYRVAHAPRPDGDLLLVLTDDDAPEFRLMSTPLATPDRASWTELVGEDPAERLESVEVFAGHVVLVLRREGSPLLRIVRRDGAETAVDVHPGVPAGTIRLGTNEDYFARSVVVVVESYTEPTAWYEVDLDTGTRSLLKRQEAPGYDRQRYVSERYSVEAADGELIPVTVARRLDTPLDGTAACLLYGYGAYESCDEPAFDPALAGLLDRGVVYAHAHVRGGGERGRGWYRQGSLSRKQTTFDDFVTAADGLADGMVDGTRLVCRGLSAGGLLMGAAFSQAPRRWRGVVAEVPFVDVVTTMLDGSIPLTAQEWDEWGDPRRPEDFAWMLAYSPYDNVPPVADRPRLLVTGAVHDARVKYWEPAKWVARLRATGSRDDRLLLRMEVGAGAHVGPSGRFAHLRYEAEVYAWVLDTLSRSDNR
jgi:oligopeptidase B